MQLFSAVTASSVHDDRDRQRRETRLLKLAFGGLVLLVAAAALWACLEAARAREETRELAYRAERSSMLVGRIGRRLSQIRAHGLEALTETEGAGDVRARVQELDAGIADDLAELDLLLTERERKVWRELSPRIHSLRESVLASVELIAQDRRAEAEQALDIGALNALPLQRAVDEVSAANERASQALLHALDERLRRLVVGQASAAAVLVTSMTLVLARIAQILAANRRERAAHLARIERANHDLDAFASRVAHEVRNLLAPVSTLAQVLQLDASREQLPAVASTLERTAKRAERMLQGLLAFSRAGGTHADGAADAAAVASEVLSALEPHARHAGVAIEAHLTHAHVGLPPELLDLVLTNVLGNGVKFCAGRERCIVRLHLREVDGVLEISVDDSGSGVPREHRERVFEPFHRVPGSTVPGSGIGLSTVRRVAEECGGSVRMEDSDLGGARVVIELPLVQRPWESPAGAKDTPLGATSTSRIS